VGGVNRCKEGANSPWSRFGEPYVAEAVTRVKGTMRSATADELGWYREAKPSPLVGAEAFLLKQVY
jgi:hypothetical protein